MTGEVMQREITGLAVALSVLGLVAAGQAGPQADAALPAPTALPAAPLPAAPSAGAASTAAGRVIGPRVVAVGDIACAPGTPVTATKCRQSATVSLARSYNPRHVLALGDLQYPAGSLADFRGSYDRSWGDLKAITRPVPGNHEYKTSGASGYYRYFANQQPGPPGYYAFNVNRWRIYALNSNCSEIDCGRQARWLGRNMGSHPRACSAIMMHHPRYSSGSNHGSTPSMTGLWRVANRHHADLALAGHDHGYERFQAMNARGGTARNGLISFVAGAGGKGLYGFGSPLPGSLVRDNHTLGVLALRLGTSRFGFQYKTIDGRVVDSGIRDCR